MDQVQLADVPLSYVKGHSGDPDNERVDQIAVAFSHRRDPVLQRAASTKPPEPPQQPAKTAAEPEIDPALEQLLGLLSRLELAERFARGGFRLTTAELAQLVEKPMRELVSRDRSWMWRDWWVDPIEEGGWRLRRREAGSIQPEDPHGSV